MKKNKVDIEPGDFRFKTLCVDFTEAARERNTSHALNAT